MLIITINDQITITISNICALLNLWPCTLKHRKSSMHDFSKNDASITGTKIVDGSIMDWSIINFGRICMFYYYLCLF